MLSLWGVGIAKVSGLQKITMLKQWQLSTYILSLQFDNETPGATGLHLCCSTGIRLERLLVCWGGAHLDGALVLTKTLHKATEMVRNW